MKKRLLLVAAIVMSIAAVGQKLPFQGKLIESGTPVNGTRTIEFAISTVGWNETHVNVTITDGLYFIVLGSINVLPDSLFYGTDEQQLEISVDGTALSPVVLFKPLATPYEGGELNVMNDEGTIVGSLHAKKDSVDKSGDLTLYGSNGNMNVRLRGIGVGGNRGQFQLCDEFGVGKANMFLYGGGGIFTVLGKNKGAIQGGFKAWEGELGANLPWLTFEGTEPKKSLIWMTVNRTDTVERGGTYLNANNGEEMAISTNGIWAKKDGVLLAEIKSQNYGNTGYGGTMNVRGPNSLNVVMTNRSWSNPDLPFLELLGMNNNSIIQLSSEDDGSEDGYIKVNSTNPQAAYIKPKKIELIANGTRMVSMSTQNNNNTGWTGSISVSGSTTSNIYIGHQQNPDLPWITMWGTNNHEAMQIGCVDDATERGFIKMINKADGSQYSYSSDGVSGSLPFNMYNGAKVYGNLNVNGNITATGTITQSSDKRFKKNINTLHNSLAKISLIEGVSYNWRQDEFPSKNFSSDKQIGVIAQKVEAQFPALVKTDKDGYKSVNYNGFTAVLLEAVKELNTRIEKLEAVNNTLKAELSVSASNRSEIGDIKAQMHELTKIIKTQGALQDTDNEEFATTPGLK